MQWKLRRNKEIWKGDFFQMMTERHCAIWWRNMFREWIPKHGDSNWNSTSPSTSFNPGNRQRCENQKDVAFWAWVLEKVWKIDTKVLRKKQSANQRCGVWKWSEIEQGANQVISRVGKNGKTKETVWQPYHSSSEHTEILQYTTLMI